MLTSNNNILPIDHYNAICKTLYADMVLEHFDDRLPRLPWNEAEAKKLQDTNIHCGQFKLLLSELLPLSMYNQYYDIVVYVGAAPGHHIHFLANILPDKEFLLYDPATIGFDPRLLACKNVTTFKKYFTEEDAEKLQKEYSQKNIFFISDIRHENIGKTKTKSYTNVEALNEVIIQDMELQKQCYYYLKPTLSLFKFRLPWNTTTTSYLEGDIFFPVYGKPSTTESRLLVVGSNAKEVEYDNKRYEEQMFYFNNIIRPQEQYDQFTADVILHLYQKYLNSDKKHQEIKDTIGQSLYNN